MKRFLYAFLSTGLLLSGFAASAQERYSDVRISIERNQLSRLPEIGVEADHGSYSEKDHTFSTTVSASDREKLDKAGIRYAVMVEDVTKDFLQRNDPQDFFKYEPSRQSTGVVVRNFPNQRLLFQSPRQAIANTITTPLAFNQGSMGGYLTLAQLKLELDSMKLNYPGLVDIDTIGFTYYNRPIWGVRITANVDQPSGNKGQVLITGAHHAREAITVSNVIFYMQYLLQNYATNAGVKELVDNRDLYFVPCVNPDGYDYNYQTNPGGGGMHRKNRSPIGATGTTNVGVDPNRNYGYGWGYNNTGSSPTYSSDTYRGTGPFSEKETQAIRDLMRSRRFLLAINYHCYGGDVVVPPGVDTLILTTQQAADIAYYGAVNATYNAYVVGPPIQTVGYNTNGGVQDFMLKGDAGYRPGCIGGDPEINCGSFWPSASNIIPYCKQTFYGSVQTSLMAGAYAKVEDATNLALSSTADSFRFVAQRLGVIDSAVTVSIIPMENIDSVGAPVTISSISSWRGEVRGAITYKLTPGLAPSTRIRYVWKAVCGGITVLDTVIRYYNPTVLFTDNMESGSATTKWTVSSGWAYTTTAAYAGTRSIAESPSGNYGNNAALNLTCKTILNLSGATDASLSYWVKYNCENGYDKLQVKFSTNGTGTGATFTALPGQRTITESVGTIGGVPSYTGTQGTWIRETISLKSLLGQTNVGLRFTFSSDAGDVADGFYIDNVEVAKINGSPVLARAAQTLAGRTERGSNILDWTNQDGEYEAIVVQRSGNGSDFVNLQLCDNQLTFTDAEPLEVNYYRLQMTDYKKEVSYSNTVVLNNSQLPELSFNNPVAGELTVDAAAIPDARTLCIYSVNGAKLAEQSIEPGNKAIRVSVKQLLPGSYVFTIADSRGKLQAKRLFVKE